MSGTGREKKQCHQHTPAGAGGMRKYVARDTVLDVLEKDGREAKKGLRIEQRPVPPWEWRKRKEREWAGLFLDVGAHGFSSEALSGTRIVGLNKSGSG